jgi:PrtD family type I secretion system ABC transporter
MYSSDSISPLRAGVLKIRSALIAAGGLSLFINLLVFASPLFTMQIYDRVLTSRSSVTLLMLSLIAAILFVSYAALEHYRSRILVQAGVQFDHLLSGQVFETALADALRTRGVHHVQLLRDLDTVRDVLSGGVVTALMDIPWTPIFLGICFLMHFWIGVVALVGAVLILAVASLNERVTREPLTLASLKNIHAIDRLTSSLRNAEAIRGLGMEHAVRTHWGALHNESLSANVSAVERGGSLLAVSKFLRMILQISILGVGAALAIHQEISGGVLFAASLIMGRALAPIESVVAQWRAIASARASYARLDNAVKPTLRRPRTHLPALKGEITIEDLTVLAPGTKKAVLSDINLKIKPGEIVGIVGESGCGKSSLARALVGAWPAACGCIRIDGNDLRHFNASELGTALGYLPQDVELFPGTVRDNIARLREDAADEEVVQAAIQACAHAMIQRLPDGYDTFVGEDGSNLSGGQRQRVGLARAVFRRPAFVLLDEPNSNLDNEGDRALAQTIQHLRTQGTTVLVVSHRPNLLAVVDRIVFMHAGQIRHAGPRDDLLPLLRGDAGAARQRPMPQRAPFPPPHHLAHQPHAASLRQHVHETRQ